jgi:hypothetical protein
MAVSGAGGWRAFVKNPDSPPGQGFNDQGSGAAYAINNNGLVVEKENQKGVSSWY